MRIGLAPSVLPRPPRVVLPLHHLRPEQTTARLPPSQGASQPFAERPLGRLLHQHVVDLLWVLVDPERTLSRLFDPTPSNCSLVLAFLVLIPSLFAMSKQMMNRSTIRSRYNIRGDGCSDCLTSFCCTCCQLVQESREIELEEQSLGFQRS